MIDANKFGVLEGGFLKGFRDSVSERRFMGWKGFGGFLNQFSPKGPKLIDAIDGK